MDGFHCRQAGKAVYTNLVITHISGGGKGVVRKGLQGEQSERCDGLPHGLKPPQQEIGTVAVNLEP